MSETAEGVQEGLRVWRTAHEAEAAWSHCSSSELDAPSSLQSQHPHSSCPTACPSPTSCLLLPLAPQVCSAWAVQKAPGTAP